MSVEEDDFFSVFASNIKGWYINDGFGVLAEKSTGRFFFFTDDEIDEEAFADLFRAKEGDDVEIGVVLIKGEVVDEVFVGFEFVGGFVEGEDVDDFIGCFVGMRFGLVKGRVFLELVVSGDGSKEVVVIIVEE